MEKVKVKIINTGKKFTFNSGILIADIASAAGNDLDKNSLCATINNKLVDLTYAVKVNSEIEFFDFNSNLGNSVYRKTAVFILEKVLKTMYPKTKITIGMHLENGFYFDFYNEKVNLTKKILDKIKKEMKELVKQDLPVNRKLISFIDLIKYFKKLGLTEKIKIVKTLNKGGINVYELDRFLDICLFPMALSTGYIKNFDLISYGKGFILRFPMKNNISKIPPKLNQKKLFKIYQETKKWYRILGIEDVTTLNNKIANPDFSEIVKVAEALQEKKIANIADKISQNKNIKFVLVAGPSSSGKTTFSKRLSVALTVNGIKPIAISLDDYFLDRTKTPRDENGEYDFEAVEALNLKLINTHLKNLLKGKKISLPKFDFATGISSTSKHTMKLEDNNIVIIEGIHGLNEKLTQLVPAKNKFKIYISALTQLRISDTTRISTTDTRLIRRLVRDFSYRGYSAQDTISRWPSVKRGEAKNIFPFQENADILFNSGIVYEFSVLKSFAIPILKKVTTAEPEYRKARQLIDILSLFDTIGTKEIPPTSILREFIGGSSFHY